MEDSAQKHRVADPHLLIQQQYPLRVPGKLLLNIFYRNKKSSWCVSNCRSIEVPIIYPSPSPSQATSIASRQNPSTQETDPYIESPADMDLHHEHPAATISPVTSSTSREGSSHPTITGQEEVFRFLALPVELRLKIYGYLLPPRTHVVVTQIPHSGLFWNTSNIPFHSAQSFYPFGRNPPKQLLTTYKVLNTNFRHEFPAPSIHAQIFLVCKQIRDEAEPVLYGNPETVFDFGVYTDALITFFEDRSVRARENVKNIRIAREIPALEHKDGLASNGIDGSWARFSAFLKDQLPNIRTLDLTIWSSSGSISSFPRENGSSEEKDEALEALAKVEFERKWREWEWTSEILKLEALNHARVTWWGFQKDENMQGANVKRGFDAWLAGRMVADKVVRSKMIRGGVVEEGFIVVPGNGA